MSNRQNLSNDRHEFRTTLFSSTDAGTDPARVRDSLLRRMIGVPPSRPMVDSVDTASKVAPCDRVPEVSERIQ